MMRSDPSTRDMMADGISIRVRVRRAPCTSKMEYADAPQDMVCTIANWESQAGGGAGTRRRPGSPRRNTFANKFRSNSSSKSDPAPYGQVAPMLFFQTRTHTGPTLEACCSLHSVSSFDSLDHSIVSEKTPVGDMVKASNKHRRHCTLNIMNDNQRKKSYSVPCSSIKTVEKVSSLLRGYRVFFATGSRGSYELEFENKNGMDIMMAFLQATLPAERFVNSCSGSVDASDNASYLSTLDVEKLTERLAERESQDTMSEKVRKSVGQMVSGIEEMSNSFCGNVCCSGNFMTAASVVPYDPEPAYEVRDSPPKGTDRKSFQEDASHSPLMEIDDEEKSSQGANFIMDAADPDILNKRMYLKEYKLPSGLSIELPE